MKTLPLFSGDPCSTTESENPRWNQTAKPAEWQGREQGQKSDARPPLQQPPTSNKHAQDSFDSIDLDQTGHTVNKPVHESLVIPPPFARISNSDKTGAITPQINSSINQNPLLAHIQGTPVRSSSPADEEPLILGSGNSAPPLAVAGAPFQASLRATDEGPNSKPPPSGLNAGMPITATDIRTIAQDPLIFGGQQGSGRDTDLEKGFNTPTQPARTAEFSGIPVTQDEGDTLFIGTSQPISEQSQEALPHWDDDRQYS